VTVIDPLSSRSDRCGEYQNDIQVDITIRHDFAIKSNTNLITTISNFSYANLGLSLP